MVLSINEPNFPNVGNIMMQPACLLKSNSNELSKEISIGYGILPSSSKLLPTLEILDDHINNTGIFAEILKNDSFADNELRVAAYSAFEKNDFVNSLVLFSKLSNKRVFDIMMMSYLFYSLDRYVVAEEALMSLFLLGDVSKYNIYEKTMFLSLADLLSRKLTLSKSVSDMYNKFKNNKKLKIVEYKELPLLACYLPKAF